MRIASARFVASTLVFALILAACSSVPARSSGYRPDPTGSMTTRPMALRPVVTAEMSRPTGLFGVVTAGADAWVATDGGIVRIDATDDRVTALRSLPPGAWRSMVFADHSLWVAEARQTIDVNPSSGRIMARIPGSVQDLSFGAGSLWGLRRDARRYSLIRIDPRSRTVLATPLPFGKYEGMSVGFGAVWLSASLGAACGSCLLRVLPSRGRIVGRIHGADLFGSVATGDGAVWASDGISVARIDPRSDRVVATIRLLPPRSQGVPPIVYGSGLIAPGRDAVWVTEASGHGPAHLVRVDPATNRIVGSGVRVGLLPDAMAASERTAWLVSEQDRLYRVDLVACAPTRCTPAAPAFPRSHPSPVVWLASLHLVGARVGWAQRWTGNPTIDAPSHLVVTRTTDTGRTWSRVRSLDAPSMGPAPLLFALDARRAWLAGSAGHGVSSILTTTDAGRHWSASAPVRSRGKPRFLDFVNPSHGWLLEDLGAAMGADAIDVFETVDGGERWRSVARTSPIDDPDGSRGTIPVSCDKAGLSFVTTNTGWITGACNRAGIFFFVTHDGGRRWAAQSLPLPPAACSEGGCVVSAPIFFGRVGFLTVARVGSTLLFVSYDAGAIWTSIRSPKAFGDDPQVDVVDRRHIVVLTGYSNRPHHSLIASADAGATWRVVRPTLGFDQPGATLDFVTAAEGLLWVPAGETTEARPLYETVNGGRTWSRFTPSLHPTVCR